jgi:TolA-binding protein
MIRAGQAEATRFQPKSAGHHFNAVEQLPRNSKWRAVAQLHKATRLYNHKRAVERATRMLSEIAERYPNTPEAIDALYFRGRMLQWAGNRTEARKAFRIAKRRYPDHDRLHKAAAKRLKELQEAKDD